MTNNLTQDIYQVTADEIPRTGRFGAYFDKSTCRLSYTKYISRITQSVLDGRNYLFWVRTFNVSGDDIRPMFTSGPERIKLSVRIVLENYTDAKIGEFTILPDQSDIELFSTAIDDGYPIQVARLGDIYLEEAGWVAPNYQPAWFRISADKYELDEFNRLHM